MCYPTTTVDGGWRWQLRRDRDYLELLAATALEEDKAFLAGGPVVVRLFGPSLACRVL